MPVGERIVFSAASIVSPDSTDHDLWSIHADGRYLRRLTDTPSVAEDHPVHSPNGARIAYSHGTASRTTIGIMHEYGRHPRSTGVTGVPMSWRNY